MSIASIKDYPCAVLWIPAADQIKSCYVCFWPGGEWFPLTLHHTLDEVNNFLRKEIPRNDCLFLNIRMPRTGFLKAATTEFNIGQLFLITKHCLNCYTHQISHIIYKWYSQLQACCLSSLIQTSSTLAFFRVSEYFFNCVAPDGLQIYISAISCSWNEIKWLQTTDTCQRK